MGEQKNHEAREMFIAEDNRVDRHLRQCEH